MYPNVRMNWHTCMSGKIWQCVIWVCEPVRHRQTWITKHDYPKMPCVPAEEHHREKVVKVAKFINAMVSRPVGRAEMLSNTKVKKEWKGLIDQGVFDLSVIREYYDVARKAKQKNEEVHMARAHGIIVEKHSQLSEEDPRRKYKGRGVVLGNQIKNQTSDAALFQDLATFEASRWAGFLGCLDGWDVQMADTAQAYIQARLRGPPCWSFHPKPFLRMTKNDGISSKDLWLVW